MTKDLKKAHLKLTSPYSSSQKYNFSIARDQNIPNLRVTLDHIYDRGTIIYMTADDIPDRICHSKAWKGVYTGHFWLCHHYFIIRAFFSIQTLLHSLLPLYNKMKNISLALHIELQCQYDICHFKKSSKNHIPLNKDLRASSKFVIFPCSFNLGTFRPTDFIIELYLWNFHY